MRGCLHRIYKLNRRLRLISLVKEAADCQINITLNTPSFVLFQKLEREDFFNVGVSCFLKQKKFLGIKVEINETKLKKAYPFWIGIGSVFKALFKNAWKLVCEGVPKGGKI